MRSERPWNGLGSRLLKAVQGNAFFYDAVAREPRRTAESVIVATTSALVMGLGLVLVGRVTPRAWVIGALAWAGVILVLFAGIAWLLGAVFGGTASYPQVARGVGYAVVPQALAFIPIGGFVPGFVIGAIWACWCSVVAVREAHEIPTRNALIVVAAPVLLAIGTMPIVLVVTGVA